VIHVELTIHELCLGFDVDLASSLDAQN